LLTITTVEKKMKAYIASLALGLLVGAIYALLNVRSPAPPVVALVGLLGILLGEHIPPLFKHAFTMKKSASVWIEEQAKPNQLTYLSHSKKAHSQLKPDESVQLITKGTHHD
jgi:XapX domain-containing protein